MLTKLSAALAAICMLSAPALAQESAKPTEPQIAHIAYTADEIDIKAAKQALSKSRNKEVRACAADGSRPYGREQTGPRSGEKAQRHPRRQ